MNVVVVESPAKARTINKYLGGDYVVLSSYGHVRDLPAKDGSVRPDEDFAMDYVTDTASKKRIDEIAAALKKADTLILATDPDREGEAISWHLLEALQRKRGLGDYDVKRVSFNAITKASVQEAMLHPREVDMDLVNAQQARRALDYLVGFTLSPVLWRKLPGARSAGRVQSVALRLICEREREIESFVTQEYWSVEVDLLTPRDEAFVARLTHLDGEKLDRFSIGDGDRAGSVKARLLESDYRVTSIESKQVRRHPAPPFTTSTLQQEASRKLGMGAKRTMQVAQRLYEGVDVGGERVGLITYMRTDGVSLAPEALAATRNLIGSKYGARYKPAKARVYKTKSKNAQEAHEAIRPTDPNRLPAAVKSRLHADEYKLYTLIWKRTVASQMESAIFERATVVLDAAGAGATLRASGQVPVFDGFLKLYQQGRDDDKPGDDDSRALPKMHEGETPSLSDVRADQHFTEPPPRFTEATLVKRLEELGIGRPSTYASILSVLQDRKYVKLDRRRFTPEGKGRLVIAFLESFFRRYVEYDFTAQLEERLDEVSAGKVDWKLVLREFWDGFAAAVGETKDLRTTEVLNRVDEVLGPYVFPKREDGSDPRKCLQCDDGKLSLRLGKFGAFVGCSNYPECKFTREVVAPEEGEENQGPRVLGSHPESGLDVTVKKGPYGHYIQLGEATEDEDGKKVKPKRVSLLKGQKPGDITLPMALELLSLPRDLGVHPDDGKRIEAGIGRYGPYVKHERTYANLKAGQDVLTVELATALELLAAKKAGGRGRREPLRELGAHPDDGAQVQVMAGRYGPYVTHDGVHATIPRGSSPDDLTLEAALKLLADKIARGGGKKRGRKKASRKKTTRKKATKKASRKKASKKKATRKKSAKKATAKSKSSD